MKADLKAGDTVYDAMTDLFKFHREYGVPEKDDNYWAALIEAAGEINERYKDTKMAGIVSRHLVGIMLMLDKEVKDI